MARKPAVVAELGRPETAGETAARKAEQSRLYRQRKTVNNLVFSLLVSVGAVLIIFLMVPRGTGDFDARAVDVAALAAEHSPSAGRELIAPEVPEDWLARRAEFRTEGSVNSWQITYNTPKPNEAYIAVVQAFDTSGREVDERWIAERLEQQSATGTEQLGGAQWTVYDHPNRSPDGANMIFGLEHRTGDTVLLVFGTERPEVLRMLAIDALAALEGGAR